MGLPDESALKSLEHPKNPDTSYAFPFKDYMAVVSADREDVGIFLGAVANNLTSRLPLQIDTIGVFTGYSEFDAYDRDDSYAYPNPATAWASRHSAENTNLINPDASELEAYYSIVPFEQHSIELANKPNGSDGQSVKLWGGSLSLKGTLQIPNDPDLTAQIAAGYVSLRLSKIGLWASNGQDKMSSSNVITIERVYTATEPQFLDRPYNPY